MQCELLPRLGSLNLITLVLRFEQARSAST